MHKIQEDFSNELKNGQILVIMPITRLIFDEPFNLGKFKFFPPGFININHLRPMPFKIPSHTILPNGISEISLEEQDLREFSTFITGFSVEILQSHHLVVFTTELDWEEFLTTDHHIYDIRLLKLLSAKAERALDMIRFDYCRFDLPDTLPGIPGSWDNSREYLGALLYTFMDNESYLIAGAAINSTIQMKGLGLEISPRPTNLVLEPSQGEVAAIAVHGLSLFSDAMSANNDTIKFVRIMTLLEFLATPDKYEQWKKNKGKIICHIARDKTQYLQLSERFRVLSSSDKDSGPQQGYRTLVVHHGKFLEEIIPNDEERINLFKELQHYSSSVLDDMLRNYSMTWQEFCVFRDNQKQKLGVI